MLCHFFSFYSCITIPAGSICSKELSGSAGVCVVTSSGQPCPFWSHSSMPYGFAYSRGYLSNANIDNEKIGGKMWQDFLVS